MSAVPHLTCCDAACGLTLPTCSDLCLLARSCDLIGPGANYTWLFHGAVLSFPSACCDARHVRVGDAVQLQVHAVLDTGTVTKRTNQTMTLSLTSTAAVPDLGTIYTITVHGVRGAACTVTTSLTGCHFHFNIVRNSAACCACQPQLEDVTWRQSDTIQGSNLPVVQTGPGEHWVLSDLETYYVTKGEEPNTLWLHLTKEDQGLTRFLAADVADQTSWLEIYDASSGALITQQNDDYPHDSNKLPVEHTHAYQALAEPNAFPRTAATVRSQGLVPVPVGYFTYGRGKRLNLAVGNEVAFYKTYDLLDDAWHAQVSAGAGTLVQRRTVAYRRTASGNADPALDNTVESHQFFTAVLGSVAYTLFLQPTLGVALSVDTSEGYHLNFLPNSPTLFGSSDAVRLDAFQGVLPTVSGTALSLTTIYYIKRVDAIYTLFYNPTMTLQVQFTGQAPGGNGFLYVLKLSTSSSAVTTINPPHGMEQLILGMHPEHDSQKLVTVDLKADTFNAQTGSYFQVYAENPAVVVGTQIL
jgi:hypothetical protein